MKHTQLSFFVSLVLGLALLSGCTAIQESVGGEFNSAAYRPHNQSNVRVKVSIQNRMVYVMEGDRVLLVTPTAVGKPGHETPKGHFQVQRKIAKKRSYSYGFWAKGGTIIPGKSGNRPSGGGWRYVGFPMAYWVEWMPAYGFHEGSVWPIPRTHGCLRLHKNVAPKFYNLVKIGTPVHIANSQPEDATIGRNIARPKDYADPDPPRSFMISSQVFTPPTGPLFKD